MCLDEFAVYTGDIDLAQVNTVAGMHFYPVDDVQQEAPDVCQLQSLDRFAGDPFEQQGLAFPGALDQGGELPRLAAHTQHIQGVVECVHPDRSGHRVRTEHPVPHLAHLDPVMRQCA